MVSQVPRSPNMQKTAYALDFSVHLRIAGKTLDGTLTALLEALDAQGSLAAAARSVGCSYRHAWDRLHAAEAEFGQALVVLERGRGARLSDYGSRVVAVQS